MNDHALTPLDTVPHDRAMRLVVVALLGLSMVACTRKVPGVCCTSPDDCHSIGADDSERPCNMGLVCIDHECSAPPPGCQTDMDCTGVTPFCAPDHSCVGCLEADQCPMTAPTCDATTHSCRACATDDDCASSVCDQQTGMCVAQADVVYASPAGSDSAACSQTDPCSITHAFATAVAPRNTVKLLPGSYTAEITVPAGTAVFVDAFAATIMAASSKPVFEIPSNSRLRLVGATIVNPGNDSTVDCIHGTIELDQVSVTAGEAAITTSSCTATITRSRIRGTSADLFLCLFGGPTTVDRTLFEGVGSVEGEATVTNSVFTNQSTNGAFLGSVLGTGALMTVSFSTVINTNIKNGSGTPVCEGGTTPGVCIDNSIIVNTNSGAPADTVTGSACLANYTIVFPQTTPISGTSNLYNINPALKDSANGDYHLTSSSPAVDAADPAAAPTPDFDGTRRPQGARSDMGAFEFKP